MFAKFAQGLTYHDFLKRYGTDSHQERWKAVYDEVALTPEQRELLGSFQRSMKVLCLAGAWCGDCSGQCPIFQRFVEATPTIELRYLDRDDHADVQAALQINGGNRVPVVVFFSEDGYEAARYGERTLSKYRQLLRDTTGLASGGVDPRRPGAPLLAQVTQEWLDEFERVQWMLRLSPRLRKLHND